MSTAITNVTELQAMENDLAGSYYLANDIDASATSGWNGGAGFVPVGDNANKFTGKFNGYGRTITDLFINRPSTTRIGLFGEVDASEIINVGLVDGDITGLGGVAALIGVTTDTAVARSYTTGMVSGTADAISGLIGDARGSTVLDSFSKCSVTGGNLWSNFISGLIGRNTGTITNCYSTGDVNGGTANIGGAIGYNSGGTYNDVFWDTQTSLQATSAGGTGKTTAQMKQEATFTNWDFSTIWDITEDVTYPWLR